MWAFCSHGEVRHGNRVSLESDHPHCNILGIESSRDIWLSIPAPPYSPCLSVRITSKAFVGEFVRCKYCWSLGKRLTLWQGPVKVLIEGKKNGKLRENLKRGFAIPPDALSFGWLSTARQAVPRRELAFPLGPPSRLWGEVENWNPTRQTALSLKHSRTHTHTPTLHRKSKRQNVEQLFGALRGPNGILLYFDS